MVWREMHDALEILQAQLKNKTCQALVNLIRDEKIYCKEVYYPNCRSFFCDKETIMHKAEIEAIFTRLENGLYAEKIPAFDCKVIKRQLQLNKIDLPQFKTIWDNLIRVIDKNEELRYAQVAFPLPCHLL